MKKFDINGNLFTNDGLENHDIFLSTICVIRDYYISFLGEEFMSSIGLYVDNATECSGYTPIITPVLGEFLIIKLCISDDDTEDIIAFQFAHELMHYVFFVKYGIDKKRADENEESICSAASLIVIHNLFFQHFSRLNNYVKSLKNVAYRKGAEIAENIDYDFQKIIQLL